MQSIPGLQAGPHLPSQTCEDPLPLEECATRTSWQVPSMARRVKSSHCQGVFIRFNLSPIVLPFLHVVTK